MSEEGKGSKKKKKKLPAYVIERNKSWEKQRKNPEEISDEEWDLIKKMDWEF